MSGAVNITGQKFNMLTAIEPTEKRNSEGVMWLCKCDCGNECYVSAKSLRNGNTKSCGCLKTKKDNIAGQKFGRLTALKPLGINKGTSTTWLCKCDCGNETKAEIRSLRSGNTRSCGCLCADISAPKAFAARHFIDGTCIERLKSKKIPKNNASGVKGVSWSKQKSDWEAYIGFKGKQYNLGHYKKLEDAAQARKIAESKLHDEFIEWYEEMKKNETLLHTKQR